MDEKLASALETCKSLSELALKLFDRNHQSARNKCKQILKENGVNWEEWLKEKNTKPKRYCLYCGKEITNTDYRNKFCNHSCAASYNNLGVSRNKKERATDTCLNCRRQLTVNEKLFCSVKCSCDFKYNEYIKKWLSGEESGSVSKGGFSARVKRFLFETYNNSCQMCGWNKTNPSTHKVPLQIHHIDGDEKNNSRENLQLLCPNCHSLTDTFGALNTVKSRKNS